MKILVYQRLENFLASSSEGKISLSFPKIEEILGRKLPPTAYGNDAWWTNNPTGHSQAKAWLAAGFEMATVDRAAMTVTFKRISAQDLAGQKDSPGMSIVQREFLQAQGGEKKPRRHPAFGALKGTFTIEPGWDLTRPALDPDELAEWEASLDRKAGLIAQGPSGNPAGKQS